MEGGCFCEGHPVLLEGTGRMALMEGAKVEVAGLAPAGDVAGQPAPALCTPNLKNRSLAAPVFLWGISKGFVDPRLLLIVCGATGIGAPAVHAFDFGRYARLIGDDALPQ